MDDPYYDVVREHWANISMVYRRLKRKRPVMLFDVQEQRIYAYPYEAFKADLSVSSQAILEEQYQEARRDRKIVVFVRDNIERKLVSYSITSDDVRLGAGAV